jgi:hypothetical protein
MEAAILTPFKKGLVAWPGNSTRYVDNNCSLSLGLCACKLTANMLQ